MLRPYLKPFFSLLKALQKDERGSWIWQKDRYVTLKRSLIIVFGREFYLESISRFSLKAFKGVYGST